MLSEFLMITGQIMDLGTIMNRDTLRNSLNTCESICYINMVSGCNSSYSRKILISEERPM